MTTRDFASGLRMARRLLDAELLTASPAERPTVERMRDRVWQEECRARRSAGLPTNTPGVPAWTDGEEEPHA
jgi:hypothetical protein